MVWAEHWALSTEPRDNVALWKANVRAGHQGFGGRRLFRALDRRLPSRVITMGLFSRSAPQLWTEDEEREGGALCNIRTTSSHRVHRELGPPHARWVGVGVQSGRGGSCLVLLEKFYTALKSLLWGSIVWICWAAHIKLGFVFRMQSHIADLLIGMCGIYMDALCSVGALHDTGGGIKGV